MNANISNIEKELCKTKQELQYSVDESNLLKKAIWDMLNYSNMYFLILDKKMNIKLVNYRLAKILGFASEKEAIGEHWLQFIRGKDKKQIEIFHDTINDKHDTNHFNEIVSEIISKDKNIVLVKWFTVAINSKYNVVMSFGLPRTINEELTDESIRSYYTDVLEKDKTMIKFLKETLTGDFNNNQLTENL